MKKSLGAKTVICPTPAFVIGSYDAHDRPNIMTAAWAGICCSDPPCLAISLRAATYTHGNIIRHQAFTVNVAGPPHAEAIDYVGMASGSEREKFADTGLTPVKSELVHAPYIEEFPLVAECKVIQTVEIGLHTQFIGEILDVKADEDALDQNGMPDIAKIQPLIFSPGSRTYHAIGEFAGEAFEIGKKLWPK